MLVLALLLLLLLLNRRRCSWRGGLGSLANGPARRMQQLNDR
jgi:hypothetical protein